MRTDTDPKLTEDINGIEARMDIRRLAEALRNNPSLPQEKTVDKAIRLLTASPTGNADE